MDNKAYILSPFVEVTPKWENSIPKDIWVMIGKYTKPSVWMYCTRTSSHDYYSTFDDIKFVESSIEEQAMFLIYKRCIHRVYIHVGIQLSLDVWKRILDKYDYNTLFPVTCGRCSTFATILKECNAWWGPKLQNYCWSHALTEEVLMIGLNIDDSSDIMKAHHNTRNNILEIMKYLRDKRIVNIRKVEW